MNCVNWRTIEIKKCCNTDFVKYFYRLAVIWAVNERAMGGYGWDKNWTAEKRRMRRGEKNPRVRARLPWDFALFAFTTFTDEAFCDSFCTSN